MDADVKVLERIYERFNARDIDGVLSVLFPLRIFIGMKQHVPRKFKRQEDRKSVV